MHNGPLIKCQVGNPSSICSHANCSHLNSLRIGWLQSSGVVQGYCFAEFKYSSRKSDSLYKCVYSLKKP